MSEEWQPQLTEGDYTDKSINTTPHLQANRLIRDIEALYNVRFGKEGIGLVHKHYEALYRHFWKLLEKAELE